MASLIGFLALFAILDRFRQAYCVGPYQSRAAVLASTCRSIWAQGPYAIVLSVTLVLMFAAVLALLVAMVVLRLTHGMPFSAWADTRDYLQWKRFIAGRGPDPRAPPGPLTYEQMKPMIQAAMAKVAAEAANRLLAASRHTDEEFFDAILALSDQSFRLVASKIGPISKGDQERGMRWSLLAEQAPQVHAELERLRSMGLVYWMENEQGLSFDHTVIGKRLALRPELIARLKADAERRGVTLPR